MQAELEEGRWASRSMRYSLQLAEASGIALWQLVMIYAVLVSPTVVPRWMLILIHLALLVVACVTMMCRLHAWPVLVLVDVVALLDYQAAARDQSTLFFVTWWTSVLGAAIAILLLGGRRAVALWIATVIAANFGLIFWHESQGLRMSVVTTLMSLALAVCAQVLMNRMSAVAEEVDNQEMLAAREHEQLSIRRTVARAAAEDARTMHDTLINTLSAIASGGKVIAENRVLVRDWCARDIEIVEARLSGPQGGEREGFCPAAIVLPRGIQLIRTGLGDKELANCLLEVSEHVSVAVQGAVQELVRNAVKHSGAGSVGLDIRRSGSLLTVTVSDKGKGFGGQLVAGRGLAESVLARAHEVDVDVQIVTDLGAGTSVTLTIPLGDTAVIRRQLASGSAEFGDVLREVRRSACWVWASAMVGFGLVSLMIYPPASPAASCAMLAVVGALSLLSWRACRGGRTLSAWLTAMVLIGISLSFMAGLASVGFGASEPTSWPVSVVSSLLVVLLIARPSRVAFFVGVGLLAATAGAATYVVWLSHPGAAAVIPSGAAVPLAVSTTWLVLHGVMDKIGVQQKKFQHDLAQDRLERSARDKISSARTRWTNADVRNCLDILRRIADRELDPTHQSVQLRCAEAESHLRQVLLLSPDIVYMSPWIGQAMRMAHSKSVTLMARGWAVDAPDQVVAEALGRVVLASVDAVPSGAELCVGLFAGQQGPILVIVGPSGSLGEIAAPADLAVRSTFVYQQLKTQDLVEFKLRVANDLPTPGQRRQNVQPRRHRGKRSRVRAFHLGNGPAEAAVSGRSSIGAHHSR